MIEKITSYLGDIHDFREPYPGLYYAVGQERSAYFVSDDYNGDVLSEKVLNVGDRFDGMIYFSSEMEKSCIEYELLQYQIHMAYDPLAKEYLTKSMKAREISGHLMDGKAGEYFGPVPDLEEIKGNKVTPVLQLKNGIQFYRSNQNDIYLCVYIGYSGYRYDMLDYRNISNDYLYYKHPDWTAPLSELLNSNIWSDNERDTIQKIIDSSPNLDFLSNF